MQTSIEFTYSSIIKKHIVRTKGIELKGAGIKNHQNEKETDLYNVYSLTKKAFTKVYGKYENEIKVY